MSQESSTVESGSLISFPSLTQWTSSASSDAPPLSGEFDTGSTQIQVLGYEWHGTQKKFHKPFDMQLRSLEITEGKFIAEGIDGQGAYKLFGSED